MSWAQTARNFAEQLQQLNDESDIKELATEILTQIYELTEAKKRKRALATVSKEIRKIYPNDQVPRPLYFEHTFAKDGKPPIYKHIIFKTLTLTTSDWDELATDGSREEWLSQQQKNTEVIEQPSDSNMTINQLNLEEETQQTLEQALEHSGMPLDEFIKQAIAVYAKTITGKARKHSEDLSNVPTAELLSDAQWTTHPLRASELTNRAIRAIKFYNANRVVLNKDRWCITQSAIASLTGSRQSTIKKILERYKNDISSHNQTYGLNGYSNRKPGKDISEEINMAELIPNGVD
ncbi:MAG: hypothetical protein F6K21_04640 [Symploca sp. SIO2D2]|nr:hypothetical protein [Symploca sp. SIO2C1]NEQ64790.1 hypothetical protein [Symploca sp. SIO2D2]